MRRAKPAKGRNTIRSRFLADATRELFERLGECERRVIRGSVVLRWDLGEGDGIVVARKSTDEAKDGETIGAQLGAVLRYCDEAGHKPRIVLAVLNLSGRTEFEDRHDFTEVFESFRRGEVSWVAYRGMDRLGRSMPSTTQFVHWLRRYGIGLHIAQLHKQVDLHNPFEVSLLWTLASGAELESAMSGERLLTALNGQMRDAGKGWARSGGFGFCRGDENFIVVNEEEWPYTILVHELYATRRALPDGRVQDEGRARGERLHGAHRPSLEADPESTRGPQRRVSGRARGLARAARHRCAPEGIARRPSAHRVQGRCRARGRRGG